LPKIKIDKDLYERAKTVAREAGYASVDEFVAHIMERELTPPGADDQDAQVAERLKGLGYIA
jgi:hypothetical protein